jgi:manganese/iron transport system permease protein
MLVTATLVCLVAMIAGIWASFHLDSAPAPTIILILTAMFLLAFLRRSLASRAG